MRVILDECLPRKLARSLSGHEVTTVPQAGWAGLSNGELLKRIESQFEAFVTIDRDLPAQQTVANLSFGVIALRAPSNRLEDLKLLAPAILAGLDRLKAGQVIVVGN
jgi:hypothetical protein